LRDAEIYFRNDKKKKINEIFSNNRERKKEGPSLLPSVAQSGTVMLGLSQEGAVAVPSIPITTPKNPAPHPIPPYPSSFSLETISIHLNN